MSLLQGIRTNPIWFGSLATLGGVQGWFAWDFWGALAAEPAKQVGLRAVGLAFIGAELVALDMASRAAVDQERVRATTLRALWFSVALLNLGVDVNALSRVIGAGDVARAEAAAAYDRRERSIADFEARIAAADDGFDRPLKPLAAYDAEVEGLRAERERAATWREAEINRELIPLEAERAAAEQIETWRTELAEVDSSTPAVRPVTGAIEFAPLAMR